MTIAPLTGQFYVSPFGMTDARGVQVTGIYHTGDSIEQSLDYCLLRSSEPCTDAIDAVSENLSFCQIL